MSRAVSLNSPTIAKVAYVASVGICISVVSGLTYLYYQYKKKEVIPEKWKRVGTLQQIHFYPVKSCAPIDLNDDKSVRCEVLGIRKGDIRDRSLMLIDEKGTLVSARIYPEMVKITTKILSNTKIRLSAANMEDLDIDLMAIGDGSNTDVRADIWGTKIDAMLCGKQYDAWFSKLLCKKNEGLRMVYYSYPVPVRPVQKRMQICVAKNEDTGTFGDATSYMLINLASVKELNSRLETPVDPLQFRPNFYLKMDEPLAYAEDNWNWIKIGNDVIFRVIAPCSRCIFTNINPYSAKRDPDGNPLKMLRSYRMQKGHKAPIMGVHLGIRLSGNIKPNDIVYVEG